MEKAYTRAIDRGQEGSERKKKKQSERRMLNKLLYHQYTDKNVAMPPRHIPLRYPMTPPGFLRHAVKGGVVYDSTWSFEERNKTGISGDYEITTMPGYKDSSWSLNVSRTCAGNEDMEIRTRRNCEAVDSRCQKNTFDSKRVIERMAAVSEQIVQRGPNILWKAVEGARQQIATLHSGPIFSELRKDQLRFISA
ncbi:hypothetical protein ACFE04_008314 [Oxalis oulophora]